jgi:hypothetical protein
MKTATIAVVIAFCSIASTFAMQGRDQKLGKLFITAASALVDGKEFSDDERQDSAKDLKKCSKKFTLVDTEADADYLLVVVERSRLAKYIEVKGALSVKENGEWKPAVRLTGAANSVWSIAAEHLMKDAEKWVEARPH